LSSFGINVSNTDDQTRLNLSVQGGYWFTEVKMCLFSANSGVESRASLPSRPAKECSRKNMSFVLQSALRGSKVGVEG
jgi:hypothetical protein